MSVPAKQPLSGIFNKSNTDISYFRREEDSEGPPTVVATKLESDCEKTGFIRSLLHVLKKHSIPSNGSWCNLRG